MVSDTHLLSILQVDGACNIGGVQASLSSGKHLPLNSSIWKKSGSMRSSSAYFASASIVRCSAKQIVFLATHSQESATLRCSLIAAIWEEELSFGRSAIIFSACMKWLPRQVLLPCLPKMYLHTQSMHKLGGLLQERLASLHSNCSGSSERHAHSCCWQTILLYQQHF